MRSATLQPAKGDNVYIGIGGLILIIVLLVILL
jgi:hypothetical protein